MASQKGCWFSRHPFHISSEELFSMDWNQKIKTEPSEEADSHE